MIKENILYLSTGIILILILFKMISISNNISSLKEKVRNIDRKFSALALDFKEHRAWDKSIY